MKKLNRFCILLVFFYNFCFYARNPFEFADKTLQNYKPVKIEEAIVAKDKQQPKWKIVEVSDDSTRIIKDDAGNIRSITLPSKN